MITRREFIERISDLGLLAGISQLLPNYAWAELPKQTTGQMHPIELTIARSPFRVGASAGSAVTVNGTVPGPLLRFREGEEAVIHVTNKLAEATSIHWHGVLVPPVMDGVPGVSFAGIKPGETFVYRLPFKQSGTYWYHSHSGGQELEGLYGPLIIDPKKPDAIVFDREFIVLLSDWSSLDPMTMIGKLKKDSSYFNYQKRTAADLFQDVKKNGVSSTLSDRMQWGRMRMDPTDISDVTGATYTYLMNGRSPGDWTGNFKKGERVRLRFIDAGAMTIFDVRIPGLLMTVVQADGQNVQPVLVEELRIGPGETYDVIVEPNGAGPFAIFAETIDRSGFALGSLVTKDDQKASVPERRSRPIRSMADMGMPMSLMPNMPIASPPLSPGTGSAVSASMPGMNMNSATSGDSKNNVIAPLATMDMKKVAAKRSPIKKSQNSGLPTTSEIPGSIPVKHNSDRHGPSNSSVPEETKNRLGEPGTGFENRKGKVLVYTDLIALNPFEDQRLPQREIEMHLTGNMDRYMWSIDGKKYSEAKEPVLFHYGERLRLTLVNDTMMEHPMHLHGMWMYLENGRGAYLPRKHTIIVKPAERLSVAISADAVGDWAFHCHMLIHMEMGMFRVIRVTKTLAERNS
jgi:CopA family copper-resistance protein